jgi:hypothetical protein
MIWTSSSPWASLPGSMSGASASQASYPRKRPSVWPVTMTGTGDPARSGAYVAPAMTSVAPESSIAHASSSGLSLKLSGTSTAPALSAPMNTSQYSVELRSTNATRSPRLTPDAMSAPATRLDARSSSANVADRPSPRTAGAVGSTANPDRMSSATDIGAPSSASGRQHTDTRAARVEPLHVRRPVPQRDRLVDRPLVRHLADVGLRRGHQHGEARDPLG